MPRSKREVMTEKANLCTRSEIEILDKAGLLMQRKKRERLLGQFVGGLYPRIVSSEIVRIDERLREMRLI
jgi:hypothetical protein